MTGPQLKLMVRHSALVLNNGAKIFQTIFGAYEATVGMSRGIKRINSEFRARRAQGRGAATAPTARVGRKRPTPTRTGIRKMPDTSK